MKSPKSVVSVQVSTSSRSVVPRLSSGVDGLDTMLGGGYPRGRTILVCGRCGTGKTILCFHYIAAAAKQGLKSVFVNFEQSKEKLLEDAASVGIDLAALEASGNLKIVGGMIAHVKYFKEKTRANADDLIAEIEEIVQEEKAQCLVMDSINLFSLLFDQMGEKRIALASLIYSLEKLGCTSILTSEIPEGARKLGSHGFEDFVADGVITLDRVYFGPTYERIINIVKMRSVTHSQNIRSYTITKDGMIVYVDHEPNYTKFSQNQPLLD